MAVITGPSGSTVAGTGDVPGLDAALAGKQPVDSDLTAIAAIAPSNDDIIQRKAGAWTNRTIAQLLADLGLASIYQPLDSDLTAIAALTSAANKVPYATGSGAWSLADFTAYARTLAALSSKAAVQAELGIGGAAALTLIATETLGADASAFTAITAIPSTYKDLILVVEARSDGDSAGTGVYARVGNGSIDTGTNYTNDVQFNGWTNTGNTANDRLTLGTIARSSSAAGARGAFEYKLLDYAGASFKLGVGHGHCFDTSGSLRCYLHGAWNSTSAIERLQVTAASGNIKSGSKITLYGRG